MLQAGWFKYKWNEISNLFLLLLRNFTLVTSLLI